MIRVARKHTLVWQAACDARPPEPCPAFRPPCRHVRAEMSAAGDCPRPWQRWPGWRRAGAAGPQESLLNTQSARKPPPNRLAASLRGSLGAEQPNRRTAGRRSPVKGGSTRSPCAHNRLFPPGTNTKPPPAGGGRGRGAGPPERPAGAEGVVQRLTVTLASSLFTYLKNTGKATKKATQIRYSIPLMCRSPPGCASAASLPWPACTAGPAHCLPVPPGAGAGHGGGPHRQTRAPKLSMMVGTRRLLFLGHCSISCKCLLMVLQFPVMAVTNPLINTPSPPLAKPPIRQLMAQMPMIPGHGHNHPHGKS